MPLILLVLLALVFVTLLIPVSLIQRYRAGTARRRGRGWIATINLAVLAFSAGVFLLGAAVTNAWVPQAFPYAAAGLLGGAVLGILGLAATRWEATPGAIFYTPNRWLVLGVTLVVTSRLLYGFWRGWQTWRVAADPGAWLVASGVAGSLAAGGVVLGYYLTYWAGVRRKVRRRSG